MTLYSNIYNSVLSRLINM